MSSAETSNAGAGIEVTTAPVVSRNWPDEAHPPPPSDDAQMVPWWKLGLAPPPEKAVLPSVTGTSTVWPLGSE